MRELTFREVMANGKAGEEWISLKSNSSIKEINIKNWGINLVYRDKQISNNSETGCDYKTLFKLKRKEYTFPEAFKYFLEGKEIESCHSECKYRIDNGIVIIDTYQSGQKTKEFGESTFSIRELQGRWYIGD